MKKEIDQIENYEAIRNPTQLQVFENPKTKTNSKMANKAKQGLADIKEQGLNGLHYIMGQAGAATANAFIVGKFLPDKSPVIQQSSKVAIPVVGGLISMYSGVPVLQKTSIGMFAQGALELVRFVIPDLTPSEGLADASHYAYTEDGSTVPLLKRNDGSFFIPIRQRALPSGNGKESQSEMVDGTVEVGGGGNSQWVEI